VKRNDRHRTRAGRDEDESEHGLEPPSRYDNRDLTHHTATCAVCRAEFPVLAGEVRFARRCGVPLPDRCKWHRPTRREQVSAVGRAPTPLPYATSGDLNPQNHLWRNAHILAAKGQFSEAE